jgi:hypothetical protein
MPININCLSLLLVALVGAVIAGLLEIRPKGSAGL